MTNRTVKTTLSAEVSGYINGMDTAARKTRELGSEADKLAQKRQAFQTLGASALAFGVTVGAGVLLAVRRFAEFDQAMSNANAVLQESAAGQRALQDAALEAGGVTVYTAQESANAIEELGKAGITTSHILGGALTGSLDLAASGQLAVARAAEITGITLKQFSLDGAQAGRVADVLSAGANKAVGSVDDLAQGLKFVGPVAAGMNVSLEDTVATLTLFADRGVIGEQAGTSLRGMLSSLTSPSRLAASELERLGVTLYDGSGQFLGMENAAGELQRALGGVTDAERDMSLGVLFGNQQVTAARILVDAGASSWREYRDSVDDSGIAARIAAERMDNLAGDVEKLGGAFDTALIESGSAANDVLRFMVQTATDAAEAFNGMPEPVQKAAFVVGALTAATALSAGGFLLAVPKVAEFKAALATMSPGVQRAASVVGALGKGLAVLAGLNAAVLLLNRLATAGEAAARGVEETYQVLREQGVDDLFADTSSDVTDFASALELLAGNSVNSNMERFGSTLNGIFFGGQLADQVLETRQQFETLGQGLANLVNGGDADAAAEMFKELADRAAEQGFSTEALIELMPAYKEALAGAANGQAEAAATSEELAAQTAALKQEVMDASAAFVDIRGAYDSAVQKNVELAQSTANATSSSRDSWEDYYDGVTVTVAGYLDELQKMVDAQTDWESNMVRLAGQVSDETLNELAAMGPEGAPLVAALVDASDEELRRMEGLFQQRADAATGAFAGTLDQSQELIRIAAAQLGQEAADEITEKLASGAATVPEIIAEYNLKLDESPLLIQASAAAAKAEVDAFIASYNNRRIKIGVSAETIVGNPSMGYVNSRFMGGLEEHGGVTAYARGGMPSGIYSGGPIYKFAESHLPWEAFISPDPAHRERNVDIWQETGQRLGVWREGSAYAGSVGASGPITLNPGQFAQLIQAVSSDTRLAPESVSAISGGMTARTRAALDAYDYEQSMMVRAGVAR